jgi:hypothetical protein
VRVRGTCKDGHLTETVSAPGRVTWHGACATEGCENTVYAKRVPKDVRPPDEPDAQTPPAEDDDEVREVDFDVPQPKRGQRDADPELPDEQPDTGGAVFSSDVQSVSPSEGAGGTPAASVPVVLDEQPEPKQQLAGRRRRGADLVGRIRGQSGAEPKPVRSFRHPLDW